MCGPRGASVGRAGAAVLDMTQLETARLILRRPHCTDLPAYRAYCMSDRTRFTGGPFSTAKAFEKLAAMIGHWDMRGFGRVIACDRVSARPIGHVGALQLEDDQPPEMTWTLWSDADEGQGLAFEAAHAYLDHVYHARLFPMLLAHVEPENLRSRNLALRLGAVLDTTATAPTLVWTKTAVTYRFATSD